ncbi:MAG: coenzyme F420-0:L-glutamate ligase, partial [Firmicutes bacterium]|nr:coenzyme F420-0:L-glutamate ligase [Bacillota bacterium]
MERLIGTVSRGVRAPIIREGDDIVKIVADSILAAEAQGNYTIHDRDIVAVTEAVVARAQGNYATVDQIAADVKAKFGDDAVGVIFPILSRNRFAICLRGIAKGAKKIVLMLSYPSDEVGNHLLSLEMLDEKGVNPWGDVLTEAKYRELFGIIKHPFTGVDYVEYYKNLIQEEGCEVEIVLANDCRSILDYTKSVLCCDIHSRERSKRLLKAAGAEKVYGLDDILTESVDGSGFNPNYGLLGSNKATESSVKLFPRDGQPVVEGIQKLIKEATGKNVEVMIYGDGAFKDPVGKIWELADPVVSPAYTPGLEGQPNEVKLKYLAD